MAARAQRPSQRLPIVTHEHTELAVSVISGANTDEEDTGRRAVLADGQSQIEHERRLHVSQIRSVEERARVEHEQKRHETKRHLAQHGVVGDRVVPVDRVHVDGCCR